MCLGWLGRCWFIIKKETNIPHHIAGGTVVLIRDRDDVHIDRRWLDMWCTHAVSSFSSPLFFLSHSGYGKYLEG
jgi:hypothetical protein